MRLTTKSRLAINAVLDLALQEHLRAVPLSVIGKRQSVSLSYLEQMFARLRRHGVVDSFRGPNGGYTLARGPSAISVADIVLAVEDQAAHDALCNAKDHERGAQLAADLWNRLSAEMLTFLRGVSLRSLMDAHRAGEARRDLAPQPKHATQARSVVSAEAPTSAFSYGAYLLRKG